VEKDVVRTDREHPLFADAEAPALGVMHRVLLSYVMYNQDLGYSQVRL
jgi:Rab-GTPase-TBC domain